MWNDIDYMDQYMIFTLDPVNYPREEMQKFVNKLHSNHQQYIVIVDPGVKILDSFPLYKQLLASGLFVKENNGKNPITSRVWPGPVIFPDFSAKKMNEFWYAAIKSFYSVIPIDGLWCDMNEQSCFCNGECSNSNSNSNISNNSTKKFSTTQQDQYSNSFDPMNPPYIPGKIDLSERTLRMDAQYEISMNYNAHNLYGSLESNVTRDSLEKVRGKRALVISRSSFSGHGHFGVGKWTGDNYSTFKSLKQSISGILTMNLLSVPFIGADTCGFNGNTTEELCIRWTQLSAFGYPFARNHNDKQAISQEPYVFGEPMISVAKTVLMERYSLLPYWYTQMFIVSTEGGAVARPLFYEFPQYFEDGIATNQEQVLIGKALLISPVLEQGAKSVKAYFPQGIWYDYWTGKAITASGKGGHYEILDAPLEHINVHVRAGFIIPKQEPALTTFETSKNPMSIWVALNGTMYANGNLYMDDGDSLDTVKQGKYAFIYYSAVPVSNNGIKITSILMNDQYSELQALKMNQIRVLGVPKKACQISVNGQTIKDFKYNEETRVLTVQGFVMQMNQNLAAEIQLC